MQKKVIVLGGGVAGMSAAHELMERGFTVEVFEFKTIPGGKARSVPVPNTGTIGPHGRRKDLPGEHGFRFFPRFYKHVTDTMSRIPDGKGKMVVDNLVDTTRIEMARFDHPSIILPSRSPRSMRDVQIFLDDFVTLFDPSLGISREEMAFFAAKAWRLVTSCNERRMEEYEKIGWWDFIGAEERSPAYQRFLGIGFTRSLVAAKAQLASTKTVGDMFVQMLFDVIVPGPSSDRVLNGPTNDVWIYPWLEHLTRRGVAYHLGARVKALNFAGGRIQSATIEQGGRTFNAEGDYYVCAVPVERAAPLFSPEILRADTSLAGVDQLTANGVSWMVGAQFYLRCDVPLAHGHTIYIDSPWALTSISQPQFWQGVDLSQYGDGCIKGIISVDISEWEAKGLNGKAARDCSSDEIRTEVWAQLKRSLNVGGAQILHDDDLHDYYVDADVYRSASGMERNEEPLLVNLINTWRLRPEAVTRIPNLFLASDYVRTYTDLATMEGANEAARRAVNGILEASGSSAPRCEIWNLQEPEIFAPWREIDRVRYQKGLPWDDTLVRIGLSALHLTETAAQMVEQSLGAGLGVPVDPLRDGMALAGGPIRSLTSPLGGLDSLEIRRDFLERWMRSVRALSQPAGEAFFQSSRAAASLTDEADPTGAMERVRSGLVRILPQ